MDLSVVTSLCEKCIMEGQALLETEWVKSEMGGIPILNPTTYVDLEGYNKWRSTCNVLKTMLGDLSKPWDEVIERSMGNTLVNTKNMLGALKSMQEAIDSGYLIKVENLVLAESFSNLLEQAEYLLSQGYHIASGVLGRAVLEEKLRGLAESANVTYPKKRPTLNDLNTSLYKANYYDKIEFKNIDHLISIGNNAAHNQPVSKENVENLLKGVSGVLLKYR